MNEKPPGGEKKAPYFPEASKKIIKELAEVVSSNYENERTFTAEEVVEAIKELDAKAGDLKITKRLESKGVLISMYARAQGSSSGYSFTLKGDHGPGKVNMQTTIEGIDYAGPDSEDIEYAWQIAEYKNGAWVKS